MKKLFIYCLCIIGLAAVSQTAHAQIMLQKAVVSNGGGAATNGTTIGIFVAGQTASGTAANSQTIGHFGFFNEAGAISSVAGNGAGSITSLRISPNPASNEVSINMTMANSANIDLLLYDASGHLISTIFSGKKEAGIFTQRFDVKTLSSGTYFVAARTTGALIQAKLDVVK
jgi:hypothetical protein